MAYKDGKPTLKNFLEKHRIELYEKINQLKDVKIYDILSNIQEKDLEIYEAELEFIKAVIEICENRGRY